MLLDTGEEKSLLTKLYSSKVKLFFRAVFLKILTKSEPLQNNPKIFRRKFIFPIKTTKFLFQYSFSIIPKFLIDL